MIAVPASAQHGDCIHPGDGEPATRNVAMIMCTVCGGVAGFNIAAHTSTMVTPPLTRSNPRGRVVHAFAITTKNTEAIPATAPGLPESRWSSARSRSQP